MQPMQSMQPMHQAMQPMQIMQQPILLAAPPPVQSMEECNVGVMAGIIKIAMNTGAQSYCPVQPNQGAGLPGAVEPGRLEARLAEFYRKWARDQREEPERQARREKEKRSRS